MTDTLTTELFIEEIPIRSTLSKMRDNFMRVLEWRDAALDDKWEPAPIYENEDISRAMILEKEGFKAHIISRDIPVPKPNWGKRRYGAEITIWGADRLQIFVPRKYDWEFIQDAVRICLACRKTDVDTQRYSFAGRCCKECLPEMRKKHEYPGWCN